MIGSISSSSFHSELLNDRSDLLGERMCCQERDASAGGCLQEGPLSLPGLGLLKQMLSFHVADSEELGCWTVKASSQGAVLGLSAT